MLDSNWIFFFSGRNCLRIFASSRKNINTIHFSLQLFVRWLETWGCDVAPYLVWGGTRISVNHRMSHFSIYYIRKGQEGPLSNCHTICYRYFSAVYTSQKIFSRISVSVHGTEFRCSKLNSNFDYRSGLWSEKNCRIVTNMSWFWSRTVLYCN